MATAPQALATLSELAAQVRRHRPTYPAERLSGRGIVVAAGGVSTFTNAYVLLSLLRGKLGCRLPVEIWHLGPTEMSPMMASLLAELDATVVNALPRIAEAGVDIRDGWQLKSFALMHSAFREVLLLDADQVPLGNPATVFDWPVYSDTGAVFWPDIVDLRRDNAVWAALGLAPRRTRSVESGQVLVDKSRHWPALCAVLALNEQNEALYDLIYGDKDTFLLGWELTGSAFYMVPHQPYRDERMLLQRDPDGAPLFQHRTNGKWRYEGVQSAIEGFRYEAECLAALSALRSRWNGRIFYPPDRSARARAEEVALSGRRYRLEQTGKPTVELEFLAHGEFGAGRVLDRQNWWCEETGDEVGIIFADGARANCRLSQRGAHWEGSTDAGASVLLATLDGLPEGRGAGLADELLRAADPLNGSPADRARLVSAVELLVRIDPSLGESMAALIENDPDLLAAMPDMSGLLRRGSGTREIRHSNSLGIGYQPASEPDA